MKNLSKSTGMANKAQKKGFTIPLEEFSSRLKNTDLNGYFIFGAIILVLVVGIYALFSPDARNARLGNPACGKVVVATDGPTLASNVSATLPEARFFLVVNPLSKKLIEAIRNPYRGTQPNLQMTYLIAGKGEEAVIVGSVDQQSYNILMQFGIRVFGGYQGRAQDAIKLYRQARIAQAPQPGDLAQAPAAGEMLQPSQAQGTQAGFGQGKCLFVCPQCRLSTDAAGPGGMCPACPNCRNQMMQQTMNVNQGASPAYWGAQDINNMAMAGPFCPLPVASQNYPQGPGAQAGFGQGKCLFVCPQCRLTVDGAATGGICPACPNCRNQMMQQTMNTNQGASPAYGGAQNINGMGIGNPVAMGNSVAMANNAAMGNPAAMSNQAAFGWGQQAFVCPNCNWRFKCEQQGNGFPNCPNCGSPVAKDMSANKGWRWWSDGQWAADMTQLRPQFNQMTNQPNFWQGPESTGFFVCPNCNWRMYSQQGQNQYPRCPNCKAIMARSGAYYQNQNFQNAPTAGVSQGAGPSTLVALQQPTPTATVPPIFRDAVMPHPYRGVCENCHIVRADIPIAANAQMPHTYRGVCSNCHKILGVQAGAQQVQSGNNFQSQNPPSATGNDVQRAVIR